MDAETRELIERSLRNQEHARMVLENSRLLMEELDARVAGAKALLALAKVQTRSARLPLRDQRPDRAA